jgi:T4 RnlA family RNA ligase
MNPNNNSLFPIVNAYGEFMAQVGEKDEIKTGYPAEGWRAGFKTVSYVVALATTFDSPAARECRGIVFNEAGNIVARPLHKFFNMNERDGARPEDFDWKKLQRVMDKRDGSMIHTVMVPEADSPVGRNFDVKSKKSFTSDVANSAREMLKTLPKHLDLCQYVVADGATAIFEYTSPVARIVLPYAKDELVLLHIRDNVTGEYWSSSRMFATSDMFGVALVEPDMSGHELLDTMLKGARDSKEIWTAVQKLQETCENIEGWIFQFETGEMVKVKTRWYLERHRAMTFLRERDIQLMVLRESLDDLKGLLVGDGIDISEILKIEADVGAQLKAILHEIDTVIKADAGLERKDFALKHGPHGLANKYFPLLMKAWEKKEPDVKGYYERNILPNVSLHQLNLTNSIGEAE